MANVAVGGGLAYGALGYSHHTAQDYALMRSMPYILLAAPGDPMEVRACMRYLIQHPQPSYLRLVKAGELCFHAEVPEIAPGRWLPVAGSVTATQRPAKLLTTGGALAIAMRWRETAQYADHQVASLPLWSQSAKSAQAEQVAAMDSIVTVEDHLLDAGFSAWLLESVANQGGLSERIRIRGLDSCVCGTVGSQSALNAAGGLDGEVTYSEDMRSS